MTLTLEQPIVQSGRRRPGKELDKIDIKAIRECDRMCFDYSREEGSQIRCVREVRNRGPWEDRERTHYIACGTDLHYHPDCNGEEASCFGDESETVRSCFEMSHSGTASPYSDISPLPLLIRVGDVLTLKWSGNNYNGYLKGAATKGGERLHRDDLYLVINRGGKTLCTLMLDSSICPDNTARMIRR